MDVAKRALGERGPVWWEDGAPAVGGLNEVLVFRRDSFEKVATIPVGKLPHGIWPSGDGSRMYVGLENGDAMAAIDTATNREIAEVLVGQAPQAVVYVSGAVPAAEGLDGLQPLGVAATRHGWS